MCVPPPEWVVHIILLHPRWVSQTTKVQTNLLPLPHISDLTDSGMPESLSSLTVSSQLSNISMESDGIPIAAQSPQPNDDGQLKYEWSKDGEKEIPEIKSEEAEMDETQEKPKEEEKDELEEELEEEAIIPQEKEEDEVDTSEEETEEPNEEVEERTLQPSEPGYDVDDDGLPGEPLPPLPQEVALYPSQELDPNYQIIKKGQGEVRFS